MSLHPDRAGLAGIGGSIAGPTPRSMTAAGLAYGLRCGFPMLRCSVPVPGTAIAGGGRL